MSHQNKAIVSMQRIMLARGDTPCLDEWKIDKGTNYTFKYKAKCDGK